MVQPGATFNLLNGIRPTLGDLDGDGVPEMLLGLVGGDWLVFDAPFPGTLVGELVSSGPVTIPASGGTLAFTALLTNPSYETVRARAKVVALLPNGREFNVTQRAITLAPGQTVSQAFSETTPPGAPTGAYSLRLYVDGYPVDSYGFTVTGGGPALRAEAEDASVLLTWAGSGRYEVQRLVGEAGLYESLGTVEGEGEIRFRTAPLAAGAHHFRIQPLAESKDAEAWAEPAEIDVVVGLTGAYHLSEVVPNPFRASGATFTLAVAEEQPVEIGVYDTLGRLVQSLHTGPLAASTHRFSVDGSGLAPGLYVVRVAGRDFTEIRTITLIR